MTELNQFVHLQWRKSTASVQGECVEAASNGNAVVVRDSKDRRGPVLKFSSGAWRNFLIRMQTDTPDTSISQLSRSTLLTQTPVDRRGEHSSRLLVDCPRTGRRSLVGHGQHRESDLSHRP